MDPKAAYSDIVLHMLASEWEKARESAIDLLEWREKGGFCDDHMILMADVVIRAVNEIRAANHVYGN